MKATTQLHELGQSLWIDNITRPMLAEGTLGRYIEELSVTGLTSNPTIFDKAISSGRRIRRADRPRRGAGGVDRGPLLWAGDRRSAPGRRSLHPVHDRTDGVDGFVSLEVSPLLADDAEATIEQAAQLHAKAGRENLFIKIPGTEAGLGAIEDSIFAGIPINVTLLFSAEHYLAAAEAYMRGVERRIEADLDPTSPRSPRSSSAAGTWPSPSRCPRSCTTGWAIAVAGRAYRAYHELLRLRALQRLLNEGARAQRLLWASTGTKDPDASDVLYVEALASPFTVNTMPEDTLDRLRRSRRAWVS